MSFAGLLAGIAMVFSLLMVQPAGAAESAKKGPVAEVGRTVKVHYTLTVDGKVVDSSRNGSPLEFKVGSHQMIPGFEKAVKGMSIGQKKTFQVAPEEGYGKMDPKRMTEVPKSQVPKNVKAGMMLTAQGQNGQSFPVRVAEVKKDTVIMDFNHPLAGKTLKFDVEVVDIK